MVFLNLNAWCANVSLSEKLEMIGNIMAAPTPKAADAALRPKKFCTVGYFVYLHLSEKGYWMLPRSLN